MLYFKLLAGAALLALVSFAAYRFGSDKVQVDFDKYKQQQTESALAATQAARAKEQSLNTANQTVSDQYETLKSATATAVLALDHDRMRLQSSLAASRPASAPAVDGADAGPAVRVLSECVDRYAAVASGADTLSTQVTGLQAYITQVCATH